MPEKIIDVNGLEQYLDDYTSYALFVCRSRIMPDYRDGQQPVTRKIIYGTLEIPGTRTGNVKSAKIVGNVMGSYHPHGDASIYGSMKPIANEFEISVPLLSKHGAWGSKYGNKPAAMRYTEAGLSQFTQEALIKDLLVNKNCVDWGPNFDESTEEPLVLPAAVPLLLINGSFGLGVGLKVEIPTHNINEVIDATIEYIRHPEKPVVLIPDHCMPCEIIEGNFEEISNLGIGSYMVRGIVEEGTVNNHPALIIKSAPNMVYYNSIEEKINDLVRENVLVGINNLYEDKNQYIIELKNGTDIEYVKQVLYRSTGLQDPCRVNFEVLNSKGNPVRLSYTSYIHSWLLFRKLTKTRIYYNMLQDVNTYIHRVEPYAKLAASKEFDNIINLLRKNKGSNDDEMIELLIKKLNISDMQAKYIINLRLKELSKGYFNKKIEEFNGYLKQKEDIKNHITNKELLEEDIIQELLEYKKKFGRPRLCKIISRAQASGIPEGNFKIIISRNNFIKKIPIGDNILPSAYKNDPVKFVIDGENSKNIILFNEIGKVFKLPIHKIQFANRSSTGIDIRTILKNCTSDIIAVFYEPVIENLMTKLSKYFIVTLSEKGYIKKMDLDDFISANTSGLTYVKLDQDDRIKNIMIVNGLSDIVVYSGNHALRFPMDSVPHLKRATRGNKTLSTDRVDGMSVIVNGSNESIIAITRKGYVNKIIAGALPTLDRGKKATSIIKLTRDDYVMDVFGLYENDSLQIITNSGNKLVIPVSEIPNSTSISGGVKIIKGRGEEVVNVSFIKAQ